jgi:hypothetical protein
MRRKLLKFDDVAEIHHHLASVLGIMRFVPSHDLNLALYLRDLLEKQVLELELLLAASSKGKNS